MPQLNKYVGGKERLIDLISNLGIRGKDGAPATEGILLSNPIRMEYKQVPFIKCRQSRIEFELWWKVYKSSITSHFTGKELSSIFSSVL